MTAITLATALAQKGYKVALADSDNQKSSLQWLKQRPDNVAVIQSLDWRQEKSIGDAPKNLDYLIIDAPGALSGDHAEQLVSEAHAIITPLQPSFSISTVHDVFSSICKILNVFVKVKYKFYYLQTELNRTRQLKRYSAIFEKIEHEPIAWIAERSAYGSLAMQGLSVFDKPQKNFIAIQSQWQPLLNKLIEDKSEWF